MAVGYGEENKYAKYGQPTLDLVFTGPKESIRNRADGGAISVEFSRTQDTQSTYVKSDGTIGYASTDVARFDHDSTTGESLGLLIEESRTNNALNSENPSLWNNFRITTGTDTIVAPDGISKSVYYIQNTSTVDSISRIGTASAYSGNSSSVFLKARSGSTWVAVGSGQYAQGYNGYNVYVNLADGSIGTIGNQLTYSSIKVVEFPNNWYRVEINNHNNQFATLANQALYVAVVEGDGTRGTPSGGTHSYYVWGGQFEDGSSSVSSYIPTSGSTSTRGADVAQITGAGFSSFYNQSEGTWFTDMALGFTQNAGNPFTFGGVFYTAVTGIGAVRTLGNQTVMSGLSTSQTIPSKTTVALKSEDFKTYRDGIQTGSNTSLVYTPTGTELSINPSLGAKGHISRITYWPRRLPDSDLQRLTE